MGQAKQRREKHRSVGNDTLNVAARVSQAIHYGSQVLGDTFGHPIPGSLSASVFDMVVDTYEQDGIDAVLRRAAKRLDEVLGNERNHLGIVVQVYNDNLPEGMPMASSTAENGDALPPSPLTHPEHYRRVDIDDVPEDQREEIAKGVAIMEESGMGPIGIHVDPTGSFHFFPTPVGSPVNRTTA